MRDLRDAWDYLTTGANWGGPEGCGTCSSSSC